MKLLDQTKTNRLLKKYNFPIVNSKVCTSFAESKVFATKIKYPVAIKIDSSDVVHKSDVGAVKIDIQNEKELKKSYDEIISNVKKFKLNAKINGMLIQKQVSGHSILIGMKRDPTFGPVILFGLGGVLVEIIKDVSRRIAPVNKSDAKQMISEIKSYKLLQGYRGEKGAHIDSLSNIIISLSKLSLEEEKVLEIDFNPVISDDKTSLIVDARIMVEDDY
jgi:acyl-CoA synthetase (NDP forming)